MCTVIVPLQNRGLVLCANDTDPRNTQCSRKSLVDQRRRQLQLVNVGLVSSTRHAFAVRIETSLCFSARVRLDLCVDSFQVLAVAPQDPNQNGHGTGRVA
eukprot:3934582-Rhodomonas_salina.3